MIDDPNLAVGAESRTAEADAALRPRATRYTTILLVARLLHGAREDLCRIRNVSTGGMLIESSARLAAGDRIRVEPRNLQTADATVVWTRDDRAGCQFDAPIAVDSFLAPTPAAGDPTWVPRAPRVAVACAVELRRAGQTLDATLSNLSQSGCRLRTSAPLAVDDRIFVLIPNMEPRRAVVRWSDGDSRGIGFVDPISFPLLRAWLADDTRRFSARAADARP